MSREADTVVGMKPHEETWTFDAEGSEVVTRDRDGHRIGVASAVDAQDGPLIAAAPDLARVLLAIEAREAQCVACDEGAYWDDTTDKLVKPHRPDCALDAALRKAGVR